MEESILRFLDASWGDLLREGQNLNFRNGQILFYEGHTPYGIFVLQSGRVRFEPVSPCPEEHIWSSPKGKALGLNPFFEGTPYCCTCTAEEECRVIFISKTQLLPFKKSESLGPQPLTILKS